MINTMKRMIQIKLPLLALLCFGYMCLSAQNEISFNSLTGKALSVFLDTMETGPYRRECILVEDYLDKYIFKYVKRDFKFLGVPKGKRDWIAQCLYDKNDDKQTFQLLEVKRIVEKNAIWVVRYPKYTFILDTLTITFMTAKYCWKRPLRDGKRTLKRKRRTFGISDWGQFKFVYSKEDDDWKLVDARFGGI